MQADDDDHGRRGPGPCGGAAIAGGACRPGDRVDQRNRSGNRDGAGRPGRGGVVLNGFGRPEAVEATCRKLSAAHDVPVSYDDTDVSDPAAIRDMVERI